MSFPSLQTDSIFPVMLRQLWPPFTDHCVGPSVVIVDNSVAYHLSVVGLFAFAGENQGVPVVRIDDGSRTSSFRLSVNSTIEDPPCDPAKIRYARVVLEFHPSNPLNPTDANDPGKLWEVRAVRWVRQPDEIAFHAIRALYLHMRNNQAFHNEPKDVPLKMSSEALKEAVFQLIRDRTPTGGLDRRSIFQAFAPANDPEIVNQALIDLRREHLITAPHVQGPYTRVE
jgi:hypothetical protein